ncbi:MAG: ribonuclease D [Alphaproteobacteria bacterium]|nr:ribonuclease D [Alphaproteobacteria bacterium]
MYSSAMTFVSDSRTVAELCRRLAEEPYVCVDTEFMRERTYYSRLCLVQLAGARDAVAIDALAPDVDLAPVLDLMNDPGVIKVLHACRQDLEIFHDRTAAVPAPVFDTQVAAMVCGFGEAVSYDALVHNLTDMRIDKGSRYTDWARRPLSDAQLAYAISDVTGLRQVYEILQERLRTSGRADWLEEELAGVTDPGTYAIDPRESWRRIKARNRSPRFLALVRELAAWRESEARRRDRPRAWIMRDDVLLAIATRAPRTVEQLAGVRNVSERVASGRSGRDLLDAVARARALPDHACPQLPAPPAASSRTAIVDLLRVLLKLKSEQHSVAARLIATGADLDAIAEHGGAADSPALRGWRTRVFGDDALAVRNGELALRARGDRVELVRP